MARDYTYDIAYQRAHAANHAARMRARRKMIKKYGEARLKGKDIDHIHPLAAGGDATAANNLRIRSVASNRGDKTVFHDRGYHGHGAA
jgi:hypothetical protein